MSRLLAPPVAAAAIALSGILFAPSPAHPQPDGAGVPWALENFADRVGSPDADVDAHAAWEITRGIPEVVVAILDSGIDAGHPELAGAIHQNAGEIPDNGIDDDLNGLVDDVSGWDFADDDADVSEAGSHGTLLAGLIAGSRTGLAPDARVLPIKVFSSTGVDPDFEQAAADGILYALEQGARVLLVTWDLPAAPGPALQAAFDATAAAGTLLVVAAGDSGVDLDATPVYPASLGLPNLVVVAGSDRYDLPISLPGLFVTNHGDGTVDLAAPTGTVTSTSPGGGRQLFTGTAASAAFTAAAAALAWSADPALGALQVREALIAGSDRLPPFEGLVRGAGRLNASNTVRMALDGQAVSPTAVAEPVERGAAHAPLVFDGQFSTGGEEETPLQGVWSFADGHALPSITAEHRFDTGGEWPVTLEVVGDGGLRHLARTTTRIPFRFEAEPRNLQSPHPYPPGTDLELALSVPGASWVRLHFVELETAPGDSLLLFDGEGTGVAAYQGQYFDLTTGAVRGDTVHVRLRGSAGGGHGFTIDRIDAQHPRRSNRPPIARADGGAGVRLGTTVEFSAAGSTDPDGDPLTYAWRLPARPEGSVAVLTSSGGPTTSITPDRHGDYAVVLTVSDGSLQDSTLVWAVTRKPDAPGCAIGTVSAPGRGVRGGLVLFFFMGLLWPPVSRTRWTRKWRRRSRRCL